MRKIIACMLILSMLSTTGVMCFAKDETSIAIQKVEKVLDKMDAPVSEKAEIKKDLESIKNGEALTPQKKESIGNRIKNFFKKHWGKVVAAVVGVFTVVFYVVFPVSILVGSLLESRYISPEERDILKREFVEVTLHTNRIGSLRIIDKGIDENAPSEIKVYEFSGVQPKITVQIKPNNRYDVEWHYADGKLSSGLYHTNGECIIRTCNYGRGTTAIDRLFECDK